MSFSQKTGSARKTGTALIGAVLLSSLMLTACSAPTANKPLTNDSVPSPTAASYGQAVGSGEKVETENGSYEKITLSDNAPIYKYEKGEANDGIIAAGWTEADGASGQHAVVDYLAHEFVDSTALETGDAGYQQWHKNSANKYYSGDIYQQLGASPASNVVLGNFAGANKIPILIHDGTPREKELNLHLNGFQAYSDASGTKGIMYEVQYETSYRVSDTDAANFAASSLGQTPEAFLQSSRAKDSLKDGKGENIYRAKGYAKVVVGKDAQNEWKVIGFKATTDYDSSDFIK